MAKPRDIARKLWANLEEYLCSVALVIMTVVTFINVLSRKIPALNLSFTQEIVTTMFVWVCLLASASAFKTDSHMGFSFLTDKLRGIPKVVHSALRIAICLVNYAIWIGYGTRMTMGQYRLHMLTPVMQMPGWLIGVAVPLSGVLSMIRLLQYEVARLKAQKGRAL